MLRRIDPRSSQSVALKERRFIADGQRIMLDQVEPKPSAETDNGLPVSFSARPRPVGRQADQYHAARTAGMRRSREHWPYKIEVPGRIEKDGVGALTRKATAAERNGEW